MTLSEKYIEGQWYGWNGGECPVHPDTVVDVILRNSNAIDAFSCNNEYAGEWDWDDALPIIAFRVVKHHVEPKIVWVNEYDQDGWNVHQTKEDAEKYAEEYATRIAVRYVETPE